MSIKYDRDNIQQCTSCPKIRRAKKDEIDAYIEHYYTHEREVWYCGGCNSGQNEWNIPEMLWDEEDEFLVTPCCHGEAAAFLVKYDPPAYYDAKDYV